MAEEKANIWQNILNMGKQALTGGIASDAANIGAGMVANTAPTPKPSAVENTTTEAKDYFKQYGINTDRSDIGMTDNDWDKMYNYVNTNMSNTNDTRKLQYVKNYMTDTAAKHKEFKNNEANIKADLNAFEGGIQTVAKASQNLPEKAAGLMETISTPVAQLPNNVQNLVNSIAGKGEQIDTGYKSPAENYRNIQAQFDPNQTVIVDKNGNPIKNGEFIQNLIQGTQNSLGNIVVAQGLRSIPGIGPALTAAYWSALSADERIQKNGGLSMNDVIPVLIDTVGDSVIGNTIGKAFIGGDNGMARFIQGMAEEGGTEVAQTLLKNLHDLMVAKAEGNTEKYNQIAEESKQYFTDPKHGVLLEFGVGALSGGTAAGGASVLGNVSNNLGINTQNETTVLPSIKDIISNENAKPTADTTTTEGRLLQTKEPVFETQQQIASPEVIDQVSQRVASVVLGNRTTKGDLSETLLDKTTPAIKNVIENLTQEDIQDIVKSKEPAGTFAEKMGDNFKKIAEELNRINKDAQNRDITFNFNEVIDNAKNSSVYADLAEQITDDERLGNTPNEEAVNTLEKLDKIANEFNRKFTVKMAENYRQKFNEKLKAFYNGKSTDSSEEIAFRKLLVDGLRDAEYSTLEKYYPGYRNLARNRANYTSLVNPFAKMKAREQNQYINGLSGNSLTKQILRGALGTIDITDGIYLFTPGGAVRSAIEMLYGGFVKGATRYNTTRNISARLKEALKPLIRKGVDTQAIPQLSLDQAEFEKMLKQRVQDEYLSDNDVMSLPEGTNENVVNTSIITPFNELVKEDTQSKAGEKYAIQEEQKAEIENVARNKQQFAKEMADNILYNLQSWLDEPTTGGELNDIGDRWTKQFYKDYYGEDVKILQQEDNFKTLKDRVEELSEQLEKYGDIDKVLEEKAKEDERLTKLNKESKGEK